MSKRCEPRVFFSKILLLGEYSVIYGSKALSVPYAHFNGHLAYPDDGRYRDVDFARQSNRKLLQYARHLQEVVVQEPLLAGFRIDTLMQDLSRGLYYESTIPQGYGVGSSGSLVAALFYRYMPAAPRWDEEGPVVGLEQLQKQLALMEMFFHGTSSGLDPLISYAGRPLLVDKQKYLHLVDLPRLGETDSIFLVDAGVAEPTRSLVNWFEQQVHAQKIDLTYLTALTDAAVEQLIAGAMADFQQSLLKLSAFQLEHYLMMIPARMRELWQEGLQSGLYRMKLCGSGGGGFFLGFSQDYEQAQRQITQAGFSVVPAYMGDQGL